jgi:hypothetical protein
MMRIRAGQKHSRRDFYMGRLLRRVALPLLLARGVALGQARARPDGSHPADDLPLSLTHVTVIDATGTPAQPDMTVIISGGRITALGPAAKIAVPAGSHVVDATGKFLIPGLWDMHIHIDDGEFYAGNKPYATYPSQRDKEAVFPLLIANGITGVRDMSGGLEQIQQWRTRISLGDELGPRMFTPGPMVDGKFPAWPGVLRVESEAEARDAVRSLVRRGADFIKVYDSISPADYFALADEAKRLGMTFAGHVPGQLSSAQASDAGQKSLEHMYNLPLDCSTREDEFRKEIAAKYDDPKAELPQLSSGNADVIASFSGQKCAALFDRFKRNGTWLCPTLHNSWRHAHNADSALTTDRRARFYPPAFRQFWAGKAGDARRRTPAFVAGWNRYYTAVRRRRTVGWLRCGSERVLGSRLQPARRIGRAGRGRPYSHGSAANGDAQSGSVPRHNRRPRHRGVGKDRRPRPARSQPARGHPEYAEDRRRRGEWKHPRQTRVAADFRPRTSKQLEDEIDPPGDSTHRPRMTVLRFQCQTFSES